jgi:hypothetical protein
MLIRRGKEFIQLTVIRPGNVDLLSTEFGSEYVQENACRYSLSAHRVLRSRKGFVVPQEVKEDAKCRLLAEALERMGAWHTRRPVAIGAGIGGPQTESVVAAQAQRSDQRS